MTDGMRPWVLALVACGITLFCVTIFDPSWLGGPLHNVARIVSASPAVSGVSSALGAEDVATGLLEKLDPNMNVHQIEAIPVGQRRAAWDQDPDEMASLYEFSEQVPLEGAIYAPDRDLTVSGGFIQFLAALEKLPPGRRASETVRTARINAQRRLKELDEARSAVALGTISAAAARRVDLKSALENAAKALKAYGKALGGYPASVDIGATILARFYPNEHMIITPKGGLPEEVLKVTTRPTLQSFMKNPPLGIAVSSRPLKVDIGCTGEQPRSEIFNVHFGADAAGILWFDRGKWFNDELIRRYRTGFWSEEAPPSPEDYFFGPAGRLRLIPIGLLVAVRPFVLIDVPDKVEQSLRSNVCKLRLAVGSVNAWELEPTTVSAASPNGIVPSSGVRYELADQRSPWILAVISERP